MQGKLLVVLFLALAGFSVFIYQSSDGTPAFEDEQPIEMDMAEPLKWAENSYMTKVYDELQKEIKDTKTYGEWSCPNTDCPYWDDCHTKGAKLFPYHGCYRDGYGSHKLYLFDANNAKIVDSGSEYHYRHITKYKCYGCKDPVAYNVDPVCYQDNTRCLYVWGCTNPRAINYNPKATKDDGSCIIMGCTDKNAINYDPTATKDDGSCKYVMGCMNPRATNYNPAAKRDDGSCYNKVIRMKYRGMWPDKCQQTGAYFEKLDYNVVAANCQKDASCCGFTLNIVQNYGWYKTNCQSSCPPSNFSYWNIMDYYGQQNLTIKSCALKQTNKVPTACSAIGSLYQKSDLNDVSQDCISSGNCCGYVYMPQKQQGWYNIGCLPTANCTEVWQNYDGAQYYECGTR